MDLLDLFRGRSRVDHPMANAGEARAILASLADRKSQVALAQIADWLGSLRDTEGFRCDDRLAVVMEVDRAAVTHVDRAYADYFARVTIRDRAQRNLSDLLHEFWTKLAGAYERCVIAYGQGEARAAAVKDALPLVLTRSLRASACAARMRHLRYLDLDMTLWPILARQFAFAESQQIDDTAVTAYPHEIHTSVRGELLKILALHLASPHEMPPDQVALAFQVVDRYAASFSWSRVPRQDCNFVIDLAIQARPRHLGPDDPHSESRRYFGAGPALAKLEEIEKLSEANLLSEEARYGKEFSQEQIVTVIRHIRTYLGPAPPRRAFPRSRTHSSVSVVHGFGPICQRVTTIELGAVIAANHDRQEHPGGAPGVRLSPEELESVAESWQVVDRSEWGIGVEIPAGQGNWAEPGVLCAIREHEEAPWMVGIIRRLEADDSGRLHCGIWIMSKRPLSVWLRALGDEVHKADNWESSTGGFSYSYMRAILLPDAAKSKECPIIILEPKAFAAGHLCEVMLGARPRTIQMSHFLEGGVDYERAAFRWYRSASKTR